MKNKGFTVVELITSFALTMVISVFLFEVLIDVKDIFIEASIKTNIEQKLAIISKNIKNIVVVRGSVVNCSSETNCTANGKTIEVSGNTMVINGQTFKLPEEVSIEGPSLSQSCTAKNCYLKVSMTLKHPNLSKKYTYNTIYYYYDYTKN